MTRKTIFCFLIIISLVAGCGVYTFNPAGKSDIKSIAIERFENSTAELELADQMTDFVIDAFLEDGTFKVVSRDNADAILIGTFKNYHRQPFDYDESNNVTSYSVKMDFEIILKKPNEEADIWKETMSQEGIYLVDTETEEDARLRAIGRLIESIINRTTKSW